MSRILHVFSTFDPGGPQVRALELMAAWPEDEHLILPMDGRAGAAARLPRELNARVLTCPPGRKQLLYGFTMRRLLAELQPDLMLTSNWGSIDALLGSRLRRPLPVIHAEDGFGPDEVRSRKRRRRLARFVVLNRIQATVVPSTTLLRIAREEYGVASSRVHLIPNGVDLARFHPGRDPAWRRAQGIPDEALLVGSVAHLRGEKDLGVLLRAFARSAPAGSFLALVGDGPERAALERLAVELGISARVVFAGPVSDPRPALASFDLFAMSSKTEQMPIALLEAMASGLPALATDVGDCRLLLGEKTFAVVPPRDPEALGRVLSTLAMHEELRKRLGAENRARVEARYSSGEMLRRWTALKEEALAAQRSASPK